MLEKILESIVFLGFIESDMTKTLSEDLKKKLISNIPMNKIGEGIDIAKSVIFLASDMSNYITGETIHVNGKVYVLKNR